MVTVVVKRVASSSSVSGVQVRILSQPINLTKDQVQSSRDIACADLVAGRRYLMSFWHFSLPLTTPCYNLGKDWTTQYI